MMVINKIKEFQINPRTKSLYLFVYGLCILLCIALFLIVFSLFSILLLVLLIVCMVLLVKDKSVLDIYEAGFTYKPYVIPSNGIFNHRWKRFEGATPRITIVKEEVRSVTPFGDTILIQLYDGFIVKVKQHYFIKNQWEQVLEELKKFAPESTN